MRRRATLLAAVAAVAGAAVATWVIRRVAQPAPEAPPPEPSAGADTDDLTVIKGIGPVYSERLAAAGITDLDGLVAAGSAAVAEAADVVETAAADWIAQARRAVRDE